MSGWHEDASGQLQSKISFMACSHSHTNDKYLKILAHYSMTDINKPQKTEAAKYIFFRLFGKLLKSLLERDAVYKYISK